MKRLFCLGFVVGMAGWLLAACQAAPSQQVGLMPPFTTTSTIMVAPSPTAEAATPTYVVTAPAILYSTPEPLTDQPVFKPLDLPSRTPTPPATAIPLPTDEPTEMPTLTLGPTFTPPAPPPAADQHFWFYRPVADGGVVWTNKIYPYGSTRGGTLRPHHGVEFDVPTGTEILAVNEGTVVFAGADNETFLGPQLNFYGLLVVIQHQFTVAGQPVYSLYGHLSRVQVAVGETVAARQVIGLSGATGVADGSHMHFEVRVGANSYEATRNPALWLVPFPDRGAVAGRVLFPDGSLAYEAPIALRRIDAPSNYAATTSYAQESLNGDDFWQENFAFDDVYAGYYEVVVTQGSKRYKGEVWVYANQVSFVEIVIDPVAMADEPETGP